MATSNGMNFEFVSLPLPFSGLQDLAHPENKLCAVYFNEVCIYISLWRRKGLRGSCFPYPLCIGHLKVCPQSCLAPFFSFIKFSSLGPEKLFLYASWCLYCLRERETS